MATTALAQLIGTNHCSFIETTMHLWMCWWHAHSHDQSLYPPKPLLISSSSSLGFSRVAETWKIHEPGQIPCRPRKLQRAQPQLDQRGVEHVSTWCSGDRNQPRNKEQLPLLVRVCVFLSSVGYRIYLLCNLYSEHYETSMHQIKRQWCSHSQKESPIKKQLNVICIQGSVFPARLAAGTRKRVVPGTLPGTFASTL